MGWISRAASARSDLERLLEEQGRVAADGLSLLAALVDDPNDVPDLGDRLQALEKRGDQLREALMRGLGRTFLPPLDPENMDDLSRRLDDIMDEAEMCREEMSLYALPWDPAVRNMTRCLATGGQALMEAVASIAQHSDLATEQALLAKTAGREAVREYHQAIATFGSTDQDLPTLLKRRELYRGLRRIGEDIRGAGETVIRIRLKQNI